MKYPIIFGDEIPDDIDSIIEYIAGDNSSAASRFAPALRLTLDQISLMPGIGALKFAKSRLLKDLRSWSVKGFENYLILYLRKSDCVRVVAIVHGSRNLRRILLDRT